MSEKQHPYLISIPNGYQYCPECELLTPHTLNPQINPSKAYPEDYECDICGNTKDGYSLCPICGWEHDPDRDIAPVTIKVKKHTSTCNDYNDRIDQEFCDGKSTIYNGESLLDLRENDGCPEVDCYPIQHIFNYVSTPMHWNMECSNAQEWSYDIMCKICNYVFEVEDGNC